MCGGPGCTPHPLAAALHTVTGDTSPGVRGGVGTKGQRGHGSRACGEAAGMRRGPRSLPLLLVKGVRRPVQTTLRPVNRPHCPAGGGRYGTVPWAVGLHCSVGPATQCSAQCTVRCSAVRACHTTAGGGASAAGPVLGESPQSPIRWLGRRALGPQGPLLSSPAQGTEAASAL
jgi:hypothetical protein